jgi:hypothetical protein
MIVSQIFALLGVLKADHFRKSCPYLIHAHVFFYLVHMLQEHFDIHYQGCNKYLSTSRHVKSKVY